MAPFTLRLTITGLLVFATDGDEVHLLFPITGYNAVEAHDPFLAYDSAYLDPTSGKQSYKFCTHPLHQRAIDWTAFAPDPHGRPVPDAVLNVSHNEGKSYSRACRMGDGNGWLLSRVSLRANGAVCHEQGNHFDVDGQPNEASWLVQWAMAVDSDALEITTTDLDGNFETPLTTLYPIDHTIDVVLWQVPRLSMPIMVPPARGTPVEHFQAIYDLLGSGLSVPRFDDDTAAPTCKFVLPPRKHRPSIVTEAFQCFPGAASLGT